MENVFDQVISLMGKNQDGPAFAEFVQALGYEPKIFLNNEATTEYSFEGIYLSFRKYANCFALAFFDGMGSKSGAGRRFCGYLPSGIVFGDSLDIVKQKLGVQQMGPSCESSDDYEYEVQDVRLVFHFKESFGGLSMVGAQYIPVYPRENA